VEVLVPEQERALHSAQAPVLVVVREQLPV